MNKRQWVLVVAMMGVLFATAFAEGNEDVNKQRTELMKERYLFFKENIKPKIDTQRNKLEGSLSAEDKKEIAKLREEIMKQRLMQNEFLSDARELRIKGEPFDEGLWQEIEAQRIVIENLHDQAKLIANKYRPEIDDLVADLRIEIRDEMQGKRGDIGPGRNGSGPAYGKGDRGDGFRNGQRGRGYGQGNPGRFGNGRELHNGIGMHPFGGPMTGGRLDIASFLLWDVTKG